MSDFVVLLKRAGLNEYESKAYNSLISLGESSASSISKNSGIPRARVYDVLMGLEKKGFVVITPSRPIKFKSIAPKEAMQNLENEKKRQFELHLNELGEIKEALSSKSLFPEREKESTEGVWLIRGKHNISSTLSNMLENCKERAIISTNEANALNKMSLLKQKISHLKKRGVKVSFSCHGKAQKCREIHSSLKELRQFVDFKRSNCEARFAVFDNNSVLLFLDSTAKEENERALLIESPFVASYFASIGK